MDSWSRLVNAKPTPGDGLFLEELSSWRRHFACAWSSNLTQSPGERQSERERRSQGNGLSCRKERAASTQIGHICFMNVSPFIEPKFSSNQDGAESCVFSGSIQLSPSFLAEVSLSKRDSLASNARSLECR